MGEPVLKLAPERVVAGRYRLLERLGAGGFAEVWLAEQLYQTAQANCDVIQHVALKLIPLPVGSSGQMQGHLNEVAVLRDVRCAALVPIYDAGIVDETAYIAMECLNGETLAEYLRGGPVHFRRALAIAREVGSALRACHDVGVVHADLKPENVYLHYDEGQSEPRVRVLDFGIARIHTREVQVMLPPTPHGDRTSVVGAETVPVSVEDLAPYSPRRIYGTPGYIAPECLSGQAPTAASDAFALGVVLFKMLTQRLPHRTELNLLSEFASQGSPEHARELHRMLAQSALRGEFTPILELCPELPLGVSELVNRLLSVDASKRIRLGTLSEDLDFAWNFPYGVPSPPYIGLESFDVARAGYFRGRKADIQNVVADLRQRRLVVLTGPTGCGKSSLAIAGVGPALDSGLFLGADGWNVRVVRPRAWPAKGAPSAPVVEPLAQPRATAVREPESAEVPALTPEVLPSIYPGALLTPSGAQTPGARRTFDTHAPRRRVSGISAKTRGVGTLIVIDQMGELLSIDPARRAEIAAEIVALAQGDVDKVSPALRPRGTYRVVVTLRDDLFGQVAALPELERIVERRVYVVRGVDPNALTEVVTAPVRALGYEIEDASTIAAEAQRLLARDAAFLPLVQFALLLFWERRDEQARLLRLASWRALGGIQGALGQVTARVCGTLSATEAPIMRRLIVSLFNPNGTRRRLRLEQPLGSSETALLQALVQNRLVRKTEGDVSSLEVIHESLALHEPIKSWLDETKRERELYEQLEEEAERWLNAQQSRDMLWRGGRLRAALALTQTSQDGAPELSQFAKLFVRRSWRSQALTRALGVAILASVLTLLALAFSYGSVVSRANEDGDRTRAQAALILSHAEDVLAAVEQAENAQKEAEDALFLQRDTLARVLPNRRYLKLSSAELGALIETLRLENEAAKKVQAAKSSVACRCLPGDPLCHCP